MRISDWSSDVCSSDLFLGGMAQIVGFARRALHPGAMLVECGTCRAARIPERLDCGDVFFKRREGIEQPPVRGGVHQRAQNGRASCRERVWQDVLISVVAGPLKQKTQTSLPTKT